MKEAEARALAEILDPEYTVRILREIAQREDAKKALLAKV